MMIETTGSTVRPNEATLLRLASSCERLAGREDQTRLTLKDLDADDYRMIAGLLRELAARAPGAVAMQDAAPPSSEATNVVPISR